MKKGTLLDSFDAFKILTEKIENIHNNPDINNCDWRNGDWRNPAKEPCPYVFLLDDIEITFDEHNHLKKYKDGEFPIRDLELFYDTPDYCGEGTVQEYRLDGSLISSSLYSRLENNKNLDGLSMKLKDLDRLKNELTKVPVYSSGTSYIERKWWDFVKHADELLDARNPLKTWETPCQPRHRCKGSWRFLSFGIEHVFNELGIDHHRNYYQGGSSTYPSSYPSISIHAYQRPGLSINGVPILPACHHGFYRDWDKDGICVKDIEPPSISDYPERHRHPL